MPNGAVSSKFYALFELFGYWTLFDFLLLSIYWSMSDLVLVLYFLLLFNQQNLFKLGIY